MNPLGKKFISLFPVFSLMMLSVNLYAKERRGATLIIQRKSDPPEKIKKLKSTPWETSIISGIRGELIAVKQNSILLLDTEGKDVSVDIKEIKYIKVKISKKARKARGSIIGFLIVEGIIVAGVLTSKERGILTKEQQMAARTAFLVPIGVILGGLIGAANEKYKTIQIEGMTDSEIQKTLGKLRKKARIRDYE